MTHPWAASAFASFERFLAKALIPDDPDGCWLWLGAKSRGGGKHGKQAFYTSFWTAGHMVRAHIFAVVVEGRWPSYAAPEGQWWTVDHLCSNTLCVNSDHLEVVTNVENDLRKWARRRAG